MIVVASSNGRSGIGEAIRVLRVGGSALDAIEAGIKIVEADPHEHSVGVGGLPNLLGEVELDASIMDGRTLRSGAVAALKGYPHPIAVARQVMLETPHVLLAGDGAARFAAEMGFPRVELLTPEAERLWHDRMTRTGPGSVPTGAIAGHELRHLAIDAADPEKAGGTVNFIAQDGAGRIASGVSTSGWAWKYPGRVGDSPIIGAGNYCDDRYGAAACTGRGEMAIAGGTARSVVLYLKSGFGLDEALAEALRDLRSLDDPWAGDLSIVAIDTAGRHGSASTAPGSYVYQTDRMPEFAEAERTVIARSV